MLGRLVMQGVLTSPLILESNSPLGIPTNFRGDDKFTNNIISGESDLSEKIELGIFLQVYLSSTLMEKILKFWWFG
jgi:hypothetical protein